MLLLLGPINLVDNNDKSISFSCLSLGQGMGEAGLRCWPHW